MVNEIVGYVIDVRSDDGEWSQFTHEPFNSIEEAEVHKQRIIKEMSAATEERLRIRPLQVLQAHFPNGSARVKGIGINEDSNALVIQLDEGVIEICGHDSRGLNALMLLRELLQAPIVLLNCDHDAAEAGELLHERVV